MSQNTVVEQAGERFPSPVFDPSAEVVGNIVPATAPAPELLSDVARQAVAAGMPASTRRAYQHDIARFSDWCQDTGRGGLPTTGTILTEYATHLAYELGWTPAAIERSRWAILKWHKLAEQPTPSTEGLKAVLKGYRAHLAKAKDPKARPRKASPAGRDSLQAMLDTLDRETPIGARDAALLLVGFGIAGRRGEIASLDIGSLNIEDRGMQVEVYREKVRKMDDPVVKYRSDPALCPVRAAQAWIRILAEHGRAAGPLFVRINRHGQLAPPITRDGVPIGAPGGRLSGQAVAIVIRRCALAAGLGGRWSGHSVRRGYATEARRAGVDRRLIERQGGWTADSKAVTGYFEDADRWLEDVLEGVL